MAQISIIIPTLNEAANIVSCLQSLAEFRNAGHELILVDGGSEDETLQLAKGRVDLTLRSGKGRANQMNEGARAANGDLLVFLHVDTRMPTDALELLKQIALESSPCWGRFDVRLSGPHVSFRIIEMLMNIRSRLSGIATGDQVIFVQRTLFERVGGFPDMALMEDISISASLKKIAAPVCLRARVVTSSRRWEEKGILRTILKMWLLRLRFALGTDPAILAKVYD